MQLPNLQQPAKLEVSCHLLMEVPKEDLSQRQSNFCTEVAEEGAKCLSQAVQLKTTYVLTSSIGVSDGIMTNSS